MKICFPVNENDGLNSIVHGHFGSAKSFLIYDTESNALEEQYNGDRRHLRGSCQPFRGLGGRKVDAVVVGGIGSGALVGLNMSGIKVYQASGITVARSLDDFREGSLTEITPVEVCGGPPHNHGHGCGHGP